MKFLLIPLAIVAFVLFLIVLGAIGLVIAFAVIYGIRGLWHMLTWGPRRRRERRAAVKAAAGDSTSGGDAVGKSGSPPRA